MKHLHIIGMTVMAIVLMTITSILPQKTYAEEKLRSDSARLALPVVLTKQLNDTRAQQLHDYLATYNSPLADEAPIFVSEADKNGLDWKLVAAISGVESYFGQQIPYNSYNGWGFGIYGTHSRAFNSWDDGIQTVSSALRHDYMDRWGATNVYEVGRLYAADPAWANKVTHFITDMDQFMARKQAVNLSISL